MIGSYLFAGFSIIFAILFSWFRSHKATVVSLGLKTAASICFILCAVFAIKTTGSTSVNLLIVVGLVMGLIGDIILDLKIMYPEQSQAYFNLGTTSFAIGHIFYFLACLLMNKDLLPTHLLWNLLASVGFAVVMTLGILLVSKKMNMNFGKSLVMVIIYSIILNFMAAFSISIAIFVPVFWVFAAGMILFLLSDLVLSMQYFGGRDEKVWIYVNHILYYAAQVCLALSILFLV